MAEDIKISLGADADNLIAGLKKAINQLESLIATANKTEKSIEQIDDAKVSLDTSEAQGELNKLGDKAEEVSKDTATKAGLLGGVMGGAIASVGRLGVESVVNAVGTLGTKIYEGALAADEFGDTMEVAFKQQGITDIDGEMEKVRASTLNLANDLGLPVERTRELSTTIATMGGISGKQAEELTKLSAGLEVFSGGAVKGEAVALAFSKGMADPEGAAAIERLAKKYPQLAETLRSNLEPAEKMRIANETLGESFKTVAEQQGDAGGALNKLQNTMTVAFETIGSSVYDAVGPLVNGLLPVLSDGIPKAMNFLLDIFNQAKAIIINAFAGADGPAVDFGAIISNVANILKTTFLANLEILMGLLRTVWNLAVYAFEQISNALKPAIDRMGGFQGIVDGVKNVFKFLWSILEPVGKFIIDVLVYGVTLAVSWFTKLWDAGMAIYNFFVNLNAIGAGVGAMFNSLVGTLGAVWRAITSFNWNEIGNIMSNGFTQAKNAYNEAYNASKKTGEQQRAEAKKTENEIVKSNENIKKSNNEIIKPPKAPKAPKGKTEKQKEADSELEEAKKAYDKLATELDNKYKNELTIAERNGEDVKALEQKQQAERSVRLNEFLNERFGKVKDANKLLSDEELKTVIKPSEKKGETVNDVISFYREEISKNQKALTAEVKLKAEIQAQELKGVAKEWADTVKVFEQTAQNIIPTSLAQTDAALKESTGAIATYIAFLQLQQAEIQVAMMKARQAGQDETAKGLEESLQKTTEYITSLKARLESYEKNSKELIAKNESEKNLLLQASYAIKGGIAEAFNFKQYKEEQKAAEERRAEAKKALDGEEDDIRNSFAKRETTFDAFASKLADINKKRQDAEQQDQKSMLDRLKMAGDKAAATMFSKSGELFKKMASDMKGGEKVMFESFSKLSMKFGELAATGKATLKDFAGATIDIAVNALMEMIPIWTAQIFGTSVAQLGIGGLAVAAGLQAALLALVFAARSSAGFKDGVVGLEGEGTETSDSIPAWLSRGESVITARATRQNKDELQWINKTGKSISEFYEQKHSIYSVNEKGLIIQEIEKLRSAQTQIQQTIQKKEFDIHSAKYSDIVSRIDIMQHEYMQNHNRVNETNKTIDKVNSHILQNSLLLTDSIANKALNIALSNELLEEIRALRKDTKSLGTSISRNTTVDVHGEFKLERKHITALVESNRRKQSRRY